MDIWRPVRKREGWKVGERRRERTLKGDEERDGNWAEIKEGKEEEQGTRTNKEKEMGDERDGYLETSTQTRGMESGGETARKNSKRG